MKTVLKNIKTCCNCTQRITSIPNSEQFVNDSHYTDVVDFIRG